MKIGVGIITCNRPDYLRGLLNTLPLTVINELVVINDGKPVSGFELPQGTWLDNPVNLGVGKSKNRAMKHLYDNGCEFVFIIEDDMLIKESSVFHKYIEEIGRAHV